MTYDPTKKKEYGAGDAQPVVLHAKTSANDAWAYPVLQGAFNPGFEIPAYDSIIISYSSGNLSQVYFVSNSTTVVTLLLTYSSGNLTNVVKV